MKHLFLLLLVVAQFPQLLAQSKGRTLKVPVTKGDLNCAYINKYSAAQRRQFYPFSVSDSIKLVSFRYHRQNYPIKGDSVMLDSLVEIRSLSADEIDKLTDIIYNNVYKIRPNYGAMTQCFFPRNAILFYGRDGKLKESVLLCFHCDEYERSTRKVNFGSNCVQKMEKLRAYFTSLGLKFGTDKAVMRYPGESDDE